MGERDGGPTGEDDDVGPRERVARDAMRGGETEDGPDRAYEDGGADDADEDGADAGAVGALDGAAAAGGTGAVAGRSTDSLIPQEAPDRSVGPD